MIAASDSFPAAKADVIRECGIAAMSGLGGVLPGLTMISRALGCALVDLVSQTGARIADGVSRGDARPPRPLILAIARATPPHSIRLAGAL